ncbi:hypothetical protein IHV25_05025 [Phaeovibrio sulfidiphilus]|uniref:Uncharacterized protein n=1 Tax=Phaeovibrio sulfidiphilus TaxID=1220600 RepID=A0A8J7CPH1_9PROT|nr:hypothetical protein [Phaeovibrio sulfidiphilus]MBE1237007.1 hypothetical protein [Phaeovibrio sulfidiphilus]
MPTSRATRPLSGLCLALAAVAGLSLFMAAGDAVASERTTLYGLTGSTFRKVGTLDPALSRSCREGMFNQIRKDRLYIGYFGPGPGRRTLTGIAKQGFNLHDPTGRAEPDTTYHFHNDGYSDCLVFVAREGDRPNPP